MPCVRGDINPLLLRRKNFQEAPHLIVQARYCRPCAVPSWCYRAFAGEASIESESEHILLVW